MKIYILISCCIALFTVSACRSTRYAPETVLARQQFDLKLSDSLQTKLNTGIDFTANGTNPAPWQLDMDFDKYFLFSTADGIQMSVYATAAKKTNLQTRFTLFTKIGDMIITIDSSNCPNSNFLTQTRLVQVNLAGKTYTGCGKYLYHPLLNNTWILENVKGIEQIKNMFTKGLPEMKIDIQKGIISGHDGCNNFGGRITIEGNRISFGNLYQTKVYCEKNNVAFEKIIQENVSGKVASYYFKEDKLYLYLLDDSLLVFKKK